MQSTNNTNNFYGNATGIQIQQGTVNSTQKQTVNPDFDYSSIQNVIEQIRKYDSMIDSEFGEKASEIRDKVDELAEIVEKKGNPDKVKTLLGDIKNLAMGVTGSLIASGIVALL